MEPSSIISYGPHPDQRIAVYPHRGEGNGWVVTVVHGGYWRPRFDWTITLDLVDHLIGRGFDVVNIEYRRGTGAGAWPAPASDVRLAIKAAREQLPTSRFISVGHSVGGELVLLSADLVDAVVALAPVTDAGRVYAEGLGGNAALDYFGAGPDALPEVYSDASPLERRAPDCPTLIVHGAADDRVPLSHTLDYLAALPEAPIDLILDHDSGHFDVSDPAHPCWRQVDAWLASLASGEHPNRP
ncbi:MAG: S9 family peptidase [Acidipropionibacterium sp.]|jgi:acetyl esterase/lipase|nr:S9 family peptidase [Acidipropionibacterium sp.]